MIARTAIAPPLPAPPRTAIDALHDVVSLSQGDGDNGARKEIAKQQAQIQRIEERALKRQSRKAVRSETSNLKHEIVHIDKGSFTSPAAVELLQIKDLPYGQRDHALVAFAKKHQKSTATVRRWLTLARKGVDPTLTRVREDKGKPRKLAEQHLYHIVQFARQCERNQGRINDVLVYQDFCAHFGNIVSPATVRRVCDDAQRKYWWLFTPREKLRRSLRLIHEIDYWYPGHIWQADRSKGDLFVIDEAQRRIIRPLLLLVNDGGSRADLALAYFSTIPLLTFNGIIGAIMTGALFPEYAHCCEHFYLDNGNVENNAPFQRAMHVLGVTILNRPPGEPSYGGLIERAIKDAHESFEARLPFYCGSNNKPDNRPEAFEDEFPTFRQHRDREEQIRAARAAGMLTLNELNVAACDYLTRKNNSPHSYHVERRKTKVDYPPYDCPADVLQNCLPDRLKHVRFDKRRFAVEIMPSQARKVRDGKVEFADRRYTLDGLNYFNGQKVEVFYNPADVRKVLLFLPAARSGEFRELGEAKMLDALVPTQPVSIKQIKDNKAVAKAPLKKIMEARKRWDDPDYPLDWKMQEAEQLDQIALTAAAEARVAREEVRSAGVSPAKSLPALTSADMDGINVTIYDEPEAETKSEREA